MKINRLVLGPLDTNCYILIENNECIIIDPADDYELIKKYIKDKKLVGVIITHHHFDHVGAISNFDCGLIYDKNNLEEKSYTLGNFTFDIIYTPGHKEDCITIYFKEEQVMFTGDFIFKGVIGRTDLPGGNMNEMKNSLIKISKYDKNIKVYPGHGDYTYLKDEIK